MTRYEVLHYSGDVEEGVSHGEILGTDEIGRPYAVLDAEYKPQQDWTVVHLAYATPEQAQAHIARHRDEITSVATRDSLFAAFRSHR